MKVFPFLTPEKNRSEQYIVHFRGVNYSEGFRDGELEDCMNLSSEKYPCISPRRERRKMGAYNAPSAIHTKDGLFIIDGTKVLYKGEEVGAVTEGRKQIATVGNYVVIFPDKVYYNTADETFQSMEASHTAAGLVFANSDQESTITAADGFTWPFRVGDAVEISGCSAAGNNKTPIVRGVNGNVLTFYGNTLEAVTEAVEVTIKRSVPDLAYICESNYRLWGVTNDGRTIIASKYMDPLNFHYYDGGAEASYWMDVGSDGPFTGCMPYSGHICFFKENVIHKVYGSKPSNYQLLTSQVYGVQEGCERSLAIVNEQLLYKGVNGIYAYAGGVPELISTNFGQRRFAEACAACDGERYYISMRSGEKWYLYVYDVLRGIWLQEDDMHAVDMVAYGGDVYFLCQDGLWKADREGGRDVEWSATFCPFNETMDERKGYSKFSLRVDMAAGAWLAVDMKTDQDAEWREIHTTHNERARTTSVPIIPTRCDSIRIRVRGKGDCTIKAFVREFTVGSDV